MGGESASHRASGGGIVGWGLNYPGWRDKAPARMLRGTPGAWMSCEWTGGACGFGEW